MEVIFNLCWRYQRTVAAALATPGSLGLCYRLASASLSPSGSEFSPLRPILSKQLTPLMNTTNYSIFGFGGPTLSPSQSTCRSSVCVSIIVHLTTQTSHFFQGGGSLSGDACACACACECACSHACACAVFEEYILFQGKPSEYDFFYLSRFFPTHCESTNPPCRHHAGVEDVTGPEF